MGLWVRLVRLLLVLAGAWGLGSLNREDTRPGFFGLAQILVLALLAAIGVAMLRQGEWYGALYLLGVALLCRPWWVATRWLIPRGYWRTAYALVRSSAWSWHDDPPGGALVAAAWAALHARDPERAAAFVESRCERAECGAAHLLAAGLAAAARGRHDDARRWIDSLCDFQGDARPRLARRLAVQWSAADAAHRGAWSKVASFTGDRDADAVTVLLSTVARRLLRAQPIPSDEEIEQAWRKVPRRARWRALVDRTRIEEHHDASGTGPGAAAPLVEQPPRSGAITVDLRRDALLAHARLLASERPPVVKLLATAEAWDAYFGDRSLTGALRARAKELGAKVDPAESLRVHVDDDLTAVAVRHRLALGEDSSNDHSCATRVRRAIHQRLLAELDVVGDALQARVSSKRALAIHEEWREYLAIRGIYNDAVAMTGPRLQRLAYAIVNPPLCALAVWLWNDRKNRVHAHQMFLWLLAEARKADDAESILLHTRNVAAGR